MNYGDRIGSDPIVMEQNILASSTPDKLLVLSPGCTQWKTAMQQRLDTGLAAVW